MNKDMNVKNIIKHVEKKQHQPYKKSMTDKIDQYVAHDLFGIIIFMIVMFIVFYLSQTLIGPLIENYIVMFFEWLSMRLEYLMVSMNTSLFLQGLILEGIIGGFSAIAGFLPLIMVLFFLLQLLEDSGYMARVAIVMNRYFKKVGLAGKSVIPMIIGTSCSIPAVMASRSIKNLKQRKLTVLLTPFVPCSAKLPLIVLVVSLFFTNAPWMLALMYFLALGVIFFAAYLMKNLLSIQGEEDFTSHHYIELPDYQIPKIKLAIKTMYEAGIDFIKKAGTIIVLMNGIIWLLSNFNWSLELISNPEQSMLQTISSPIALILMPLGFGVWGFAAASILGFVAKEQVVTALAIIFVYSLNQSQGVTNIENTRLILMEQGGLTMVSALSFLAFNLFTPPCFATIGAMNVELGSKKWTIFGVLFQLFIGYFIAMIIYQVGTLIVFKTLGEGFYISIIITIVSVVLFIALKRRLQQ